MVAYVVSDAENSDVDGSAAFSFEVRPDGRNALPLSGSAAPR